MYYRKTHTSYNSSEAQKKIDSFNKELHEQYKQRNGTAESKEIQRAEKQAISDNIINTSAANLLTADNIIIIGLILLLLLEENKDYVLIGILASIIFLNL